MKIIKATDYGFRKAVRVLLNDADPQWVHVDDAGVRTPAPEDHTGNTDDVGEVDPLCRNNWNVFEAQFDGEALKKLSDPDDPQSVLEDKTDADIIDEALAMAEASMPSSPRDMDVR